jgi:hypothetical protein
MPLVAVPSPPSTTSSLVVVAHTAVEPSRNAPGAFAIDRQVFAQGS